jgi:hypothetical protein
VNLGGLVNKAAFKNIQPVVAKGGQDKQQGKKMDKKEFEQLLADGLKPIAERLNTIEAAAKAAAPAAGAAAAVTATAAAGAGDEKIIRLIQEANKPLLEKITSFEKAQESAHLASAKEGVAKHVTRGAIGPADTETINFYVTAYAKDPEATEKVLAKLPGNSLRTIKVTASNGGTSTVTMSMEPEQQFIAKAKEFGKANEIKGEAEALTAYARTAEGQELYSQFRQKIVPRK